MQWAVFLKGKKKPADLHSRNLKSLGIGEMGYWENCTHVIPHVIILNIK